MGNARTVAQLRVNLMDRKAPVLRVPSVMRVAVIILGAILIGVIEQGLDRVSPGAGDAFGVMLYWLVALSHVTVFVLLWRGWERDSMPLRWVVLFAGVTVFFSVRAVMETRAVL